MVMEDLADWKTLYQKLRKMAIFFFHSDISNCLSITVAPRYNKARYNEEPVITNNI